MCGPEPAIAAATGNWACQGLHQHPIVVIKIRSLLYLCTPCTVVEFRGGQNGVTASWSGVRSLEAFDQLPHDLILSFVVQVSEVIKQCYRHRLWLGYRRCKLFSGRHTSV